MAPPPVLTDNHYAIEIFQGPLLAPTRVTGLGGAYVASAEDTEGAAVNSAAPAVREPYSVGWFDYDISLGVSSPGAFSKTDFDDHGASSDLSAHARAGDFVDLNVGGTMQFGRLGVTATGDLQQFTLTTPAAGGSGLTLQVGRWKALGAYGIVDGQIAVGGGLRIVTMQIAEQGGRTLLTMTGFAPEAGLLVMPTGSQWRIGAAARLPVSGGIFGSEDVQVDGGVRRAGSFVLPSSIVMPWEIEAGVAYQLGPRPLNPGWHNPREQEYAVRRRVAGRRAERKTLRDQQLAEAPEPQRAGLAAELDAEEERLQASEDADVEAQIRELSSAGRARYGNWPREKILLLASILVTGPSAQAVSLEGFLDQRNESVGQSVTFTPRLGLEGEPLRDRMLLRVGTYLEPSRYRDGSARQHFTFGSDVRLFPFDFFGLLPKVDLKVALFLDFAPRYSNEGIAIGNWH